LSCFLELKSKITESLTKLETFQSRGDVVSKFLPIIFYPELEIALKIAGGQFPKLTAGAQQTAKEVKELSTAEKKDKKDKKKEKNAAPVNTNFVMPTITKPTIPSDFDWDSAGLVSSLHAIFNAAIGAAFPEAKTLHLEDANITRCGNPQFGDFQCNNSLGLSKAFKGLDGYQGEKRVKNIFCLFLFLFLQRERNEKKKKKEMIAYQLH
jgi:hypothetical protein